MPPHISSYQAFSPHIGPGVYIHDTAVVIGDVHLAQDVSVWPTVVIRGDVNSIRIGAGSNVQDGSVLHVNHRSAEDPAGAPLHIGRYVTIGHKVILHGCTIEDECLIGMGSIVMDKAIVQSQVLLGAGSLVPEGKVQESGYLYLGIRVKRIRPLTARERQHFMYSAQNYIALKNDFLGG